MKAACNLAESFRAECGSRRVVLPLMSMNINMMMMVVTNRLNLNIFKVIKIKNSSKFMFKGYVE
jgi:hypothetical protein